MRTEREGGSENEREVRCRDSEGRVSHMPGTAVPRDNHAIERVIRS